MLVFIIYIQLVEGFCFILLVLVSGLSQHMKGRCLYLVLVAIAEDLIVFHPSMLLYSMRIRPQQFDKITGCNVNLQHMNMYSLICISILTINPSPVVHDNCLLSLICLFD